MPQLFCKTPARTGDALSLAALASSCGGSCASVKPLDLAAWANSPEVLSLVAHIETLPPERKFVFVLSAFALATRQVRAILSQSAPQAASASAASGAEVARSPDGNHGDNLRSVQK